MNLDLFEQIRHVLSMQDLDLISTQDKLCLPIVVRIAHKMRFGVKFRGIRVDGNLIIDGHHRYIASIIAGVKLDQYPSLRTSATVAVNWGEIQLIEEDWDSEAKIRMHNENDATYNQIPIDNFLRLIE